MRLAAISCFEFGAHLIAAAIQPVFDGLVERIERLTANHNAIQLGAEVQLQCSELVVVCL